MQIKRVGTIQYSYITEIINNINTTLYTFSRNQKCGVEGSIQMDGTGGNI